MKSGLFQDHLSNQENILQSTRGLHYVFQAIFLGIGFAILAIGFSLSISIDQGSEFSRFKIFTIISLIVADSVIIFLGYKFLDHYSQSVYKRGVVIDVLQHLRLLNYKNKFDTFLKQLLEDSQKDSLFVLIKILERITSNYGNKYRTPGTVRNVSKPGDAPHSDIVTFKRFDLLVYVTFYGDIYNTQHSDETIEWESMTARDISETRKGHKNTLLVVWWILIILLIFLGSFTYTKIPI